MSRMIIMAFGKHNPQLVMVGMCNPNGVAINAEKCAMLLECAEVQLHLLERHKDFATVRVLW